MVAELKMVCHDHLLHTQSKFEPSQPLPILTLDGLEEWYRTFWIHVAMAEDGSILYDGLAIALNTTVGFLDLHWKTARLWIVGLGYRHQAKPLGSFFPIGFFNATQSCANG